MSTVINEMKSQEVTWAKRLTLSYTSKPDKPEKTTQIPGTPVHRKLQRNVRAASNLLKCGDQRYRNYLSVSISFVVSDQAQIPGGEHGRTVISFNFKAPKTELFNSTNLTPKLQNPFEKTGYHTEQVLYEYLKSQAGQKLLLSLFKKAERHAVKEHTLKSVPTNQGKRKVYAMILDMHSSMNMCSLGTAHNNMQRSCADATFSSQRPGKENLRAITARTFRNAGYIVSGYDRNTDARKQGKIGLKMATRLSSESIYRQDKAKAASPPELKEPAINRHRNELVVNKKLSAPQDALGRTDYKNIAKHATILKSSSKTGLADAFKKYFSGIDSTTTTVKNNNITAIRNMMFAFPHEMERAGLMDRIIASDVLVKTVPNTIFRAVETLNNIELATALLDAFIRTGNYKKALECFFAFDEVTLKQHHYGARNEDCVALVCYKDSDGDSILSWISKYCDKQTFNKMIKLANLTQEEIENATGSNVDELQALFSNMTVSSLTR